MTNIFKFYKCVLCSFLFHYSFICSSEAQVTNDNTLPNNSLVTQQENNILIEGGTRAESHLYHSFSNFSITKGMTAYFNNDLDIKNIFTRVTGKHISFIDGLIRANGQANLFLINPNGIVFSSNAQLNIGGSFLASTANKIAFMDALAFDTLTPKTQNLLSINVPVGLQFSENSGAITIQGAGHNLMAPAFSPTIRANNSTGLQVLSEKTLAFVGNEVFLEGGEIISSGGRIELGSVKSGFVNISPTKSGWTLTYQAVPSFGDIHLSKRALADASGINSGSINIQGRRITLADGSVVLSQNQGELTGGALTLNASDSLEISGSDPVARIAGSLRNETLGIGKGGDIKISTPQLVLTNGGQINSLTFSNASSGDITLNSTNLVHLEGYSPFNSSVSSLISNATFSSGNAGDISVSTGKLVITQGGSLTSSTFGTGKGGDVTISAKNSVEVIGYIPRVLQPSLLSASTFNSGNAGNLKISAESLIVRDGGRIDTSTLASGNSGSLTINTSKFIDISGIIPNDQNPSLIISSANLVSSILQRLLRLPPKPSGESGNITIKTDQFNITNGALVNVRNDGFGNAGNIQISVNRLNINNAGITATSSVGQGGDIKLQAIDIKLSQAKISATAGQQSSIGNGGNIQINASVIAGFNNSSITANAFEGRGGNIQINAKGLFLSPDSQITASSERGIDGTVQINADTSLNDVTAKPEIFLQTPEITSICQGRSSGNSEFFITGTGGLAPSPENLPDTQSTWQRNSHEKSSQFTTSPDTTEIIEAQGWVKNPDGSVTLIAQANVVNPDVTQSANSCNSDKNTTG